MKNAFKGPRQAIQDVKIQSATFCN